jgi:hypothetical protein
MNAFCFKWSQVYECLSECACLPAGIEIHQVPLSEAVVLERDILSMIAAAKELESKTKAKQGNKLRKAAKVRTCLYTCCAMLQNVRKHV